MISEKMRQALNEQINKEMYSGYLYMAMSAHCNDQGLEGFAHWYMVQYHEEMFHAMKIYEYLLDQGSKPVLLAIEKPQESWDSPMDVLKATLEHEKVVTASIHSLMRQAEEENDYASRIFLQWYVTEQVEEEKNAADIITRMEISMGSNGPGLYMLDRELKSRPVTIPTSFVGPLGAED
ncbi:ferritin [Marispirochaeta sp.]|uniref:ferritin n=1 Tax=Marispirochaeta sp. TaxID=2038653 RepID=UPI0029C7FCDA|nr:ferritin [Marispirochaeta sp.]